MVPCTLQHAFWDEHNKLFLLFAGVVALTVLACHEKQLEYIMGAVCLKGYSRHMTNLSTPATCNWSLTHRYYRELTDCTVSASEIAGCFWPNQEVDTFFMHVHRVYLSECTPQPSVLQDPTAEILGLLISIPVVLTPVMAGLVVWCSKRNNYSN
uniref:Receptor activity modifying protein 1 n=1 Tax=Eptatretus burgeri TaxID=7764 RepID=A0A8C4Q0X6_EPTBU